VVDLYVMVLLKSALSIIILLPPLLLMSILKWSALRAGALFLFCVMISVNTVYGMGLEDVLSGFYEGTLLGLNIAYIVASALTFFMVYEALGYLRALKAFLARESSKRYQLALLLTVFLGGFLESIAGFGTPVAVISPILVSIGFEWSKAVVLSLVGHSWAVSYAAFGVPTAALSDVTQVDFHKLCDHTAVFLAVGLVLILLYEIKSLGVNKIGIPLCIYVLMSPILFSLLALVTGVYTPLLLSLFMLSSSFLFILGKETFKLVLRALLPYYALSISLLLAMLLKKSLLYALSALILHTGTITFLFTISLILSAKGASTINSNMLLRLTSNIIKLSITFVVLMAGSTLAARSGMMRDIARVPSSLLGEHYVFLVPFIGLLGTYMTGSNTASNVLFGSLHSEYALLSGVNVHIILAAHNAGGALGSVISPAKILAGTHSVERRGKEGMILRMNLKIAALLALAMDGIALLWMLG